METEEKSDYELLREANIRRNAAVMRALGLDDSDFMAHLRFGRADAAADASKEPAAAAAPAKPKKPCYPVSWTCSTWRPSGCLPSAA